MRDDDGYVAREMVSRSRASLSRIVVTPLRKPKRLSMLQRAMNIVCTFFEEHTLATDCEDNLAKQRVFVGRILDWAGNDLQELQNIFDFISANYETVHKRFRIQKLSLGFLATRVVFADILACYKVGVISANTHSRGKDAVADRFDQEAFNMETESVNQFRFSV